MNLQQMYNKPGVRKKNRRICAKKQRPALFYASTAHRIKYSAAGYFLSGR